MKSMIPCALVLWLAGCSSMDGPDNAIEGGPGQDIGVAIAGLDSSEIPLGLKGARNYMLQVEVSNNSDHPVTVSRITIRPSAMGQAFRLEDASAGFNEMIDPGKDHIFDVRLEGVLTRDFHPHESRTVAFRVTV